MHVGRWIPVSLGSAALAGAPFLLGCPPVGQQMGGVEQLGTYAVNGSLEDNACSPGLPAVDALSFKVDLTRDGSQLTWRLQNGAPAGGFVGTDGTFRVRTSRLVNVSAGEPDLGIAGCQLSQVETIEGTLALPVDGGVAQLAVDAGTSDGGDAGPQLSLGLRATNRIEISPTQGSNCSALLTSQGGSFPTLPCSARYTIEGIRQ